METGEVTLPLREAPAFDYHIYADGTVTIEQRITGALRIVDYAALASGLKELMDREDAQVMNHRRREIVLRLKGIRWKASMTRSSRRYLMIYERRQLIPRAYAIYNHDQDYPDYSGID